VTVVPASAIVREMRALIGVPFKHQGRDEHGVDCVGAVLLACRRAGVDLLALRGIRDDRNYGRGVNPRAVELLETYCAARIDSPVPGCLVVFQFLGEPAPRHQGVMTDAGTFIHANGEGPKHLHRVVETGFRGAWVRRAHSFWKLPGFDYGA